MKLFQKVAATVLAAVLALSTLTACGGGGGGVLLPTGGNVSTGELTAQNFGGSYTIECKNVENVTDTYYITTDGNSTYERNGETARLIIPTHEMAYVVYVKTNKYEEACYRPEDYEPFLFRAAIMRGGTFQYRDKTYQTETIEKTDEDGRLIFTYCYENGKPAYLIEEYDCTDDAHDYLNMYQVETFSLTADMDKLNLSSYDPA